MTGSLTQSPTAPAHPAGAVVGVDAGSPSTRDADALAHRIGHLTGEDVLISTLFVRDAGVPHVALWVAGPADPSLLGDLDAAVWAGGEVSGPAQWRDGARLAGAAGAGRADGRAVFFPGSSDVAPEVTVADLLRDTAIDDITVLSGGRAEPGTVIVTRGHLRPTWSAGRLTLAVEWARGGRLVPFETPTPTPCCADH